MTLRVSSESNHSHHNYRLKAILPDQPALVGYNQRVVRRFISAVLGHFRMKDARKYKSNFKRDTVHTGTPILTLLDQFRLETVVVIGRPRHR